MNKTLLYFFFLSLISCKVDAPKTNSLSSGEVEADIGIPSDFEEFYDRFHSDTVYQIEHIVFPLSGIPANADTLENVTSFRWEKESWRWHRHIDSSLTGFEQEWKILSPEMIVEKITQKSAGFGMMRRFAKMDNQWMLIYYAAMNPI